MAPNSPDLNTVDYSVWGLLQQKVYKKRITDLEDLKQRLRTEWVKLDHVVVGQSFVSGDADIARSVMRVLYTFSCNISYVPLSTAFKSDEFGGHS